MDAADTEAQKIIANAHKSIDLEREKTVQELQSQIAGLAMRQPPRYWATRIRQHRASLCMNSFWRKRVV